ncbi:MAG: hypothetical protein ACK4NC_02155 [Candidatus Gracilibacteria bacterium]
MADELNLRNDAQPQHRTKQQTKEILQDLIDKDPREVFQGLLKESDVKIASIASRVSVDFTKFVSMVQTHELDHLIGQIKSLKPDERTNSYVVVSSDLLADIMNCERKEEEDEEESVNVLSGIFVYGLIVGIIISLVVAIITQFVNLQIGLRDLLLILGGFTTVILIPLALIVFEPSLKSMQKKHNEFFERIVAFFSGKI